MYDARPGGTHLSLTPPSVGAHVPRRERVPAPMAPRQAGARSLPRPRAGAAVPTAAAPAGSAPEVTLVGVSLAALRAFQRDPAHAGRVFDVEDEKKRREQLPFEKLSTFHIVHQVIKPLLAETGPDGTPCSYVETLQGKVDAATGQPLVGRATRFVSHAWSRPFSDLVDVLDAHARGQPLYFWLDMFVNCQHKADAMPLDWWTVTFSNAVRQIGHTLLVLQPWNKPAALERAWCLWELFTTTQTGVRLDVEFVQGEAEAFHNALVRAAVTCGAGPGSALRVVCLRLVRR